jgi:hypothetical protein
LNERSNLITDERGRIKSDELERIASDAVSNQFDRICPGKELLSLVKQKIQDRFSIGDTSIIVQPSSGLITDHFTTLIEE